MKTRQTIRQIPVNQLTANPSNVRQKLDGIAELTRSIQEHGILQPLVLTEHPHQPDQFLILAGHRRLAASSLAGLTSVPCIIRHKLGNDDAEQLVVMLVENCQRRELTPVEKAEAFGALRNRGLSIAEISRRTGVHFTSVSTYLNLLLLDEESLEDVRDGRTNSTDAIAAVRETRQRQRKQNGGSVRGRPTVIEPPYFTHRHPLAAAVRRLCCHSTRTKVGKVGCGQCWEQAIRDDQPQNPTPPPENSNNTTRPLCTGH